MHCSESLPFFRKQCTSLLFQGHAWPGNADVTSSVRGYHLAGSCVAVGRGREQVIAQL